MLTVYLQELERGRTGAPTCIAMRQRHCLGCRWRAWERSVRSLVVWGAFICLALFYLVLPSESFLPLSRPAGCCHSVDLHLSKAAWEGFVVRSMSG